jgi:hypothetical protein
MESVAGQVWLALGRGRQASWSKQAEDAGLTYLEDRSQVRMNDCIIEVGVGGSEGVGIKVGVSNGNSAGSGLEARVGTGRGTGIEARAGAGSGDPVMGEALLVSPWLMNKPSEHIMGLPPSEIERRLLREGVPAQLRGRPSGKDNLSVTVAVWGLEAIEIKRNRSSDKIVNGINYSNRLKQLPFVSREQSLWKPSERLAVRALYILGLDYGQVELTLNDRGKLRVTDISPRLELEEPEAKLLLTERLQAFADDWEKETGLGVQAMLGADPEFILVSPAGKVVPASRYFSPDGEAGCDSIRMKGEKRWPLVELRPRPALEPSLVTAEMHRLLGVASRRTSGAKLTWRAGASPVRGLPLGGHLHLSGLALTGERVRALDNAVALPLRLLEPPAAGARRPRYGALGDVRRQPHGGFEYRTPPSWLVSPRLALGALALAKVAAQHSRELASNRPLDIERYREAFYTGDRALLLEAAESIHRTLARTPSYEDYHEPISFVFDAITRGKNWDETSDIRPKWRIPIR